MKTITYKCVLNTLNKSGNNFYFPEDAIKTKELDLTVNLNLMDDDYYTVDQDHLIKLLEKHLSADIVKIDDGWMCDEDGIGFLLHDTNDMFYIINGEPS